MAIQFGPKFPKGNSVQRQPIPKPNTPINNESKPGTPTTQEYKDNREGVVNGNPGDFTVIRNETDSGFKIIYKNNQGKVCTEEYKPGKDNDALISGLRLSDVYFGRR